MSERLLITLIIAGSVAAVLYLLKRWQTRRADAAVNGLVLEAGKPALVYFTSPGCAVCRMSQTPIVENLRAAIEADRVQWISIDAGRQVDLARQWGVTTLPTTYIIDRSGRIAHINNGLVTAKELNRQLFYSSRVSPAG